MNKKILCYLLFLFLTGILCHGGHASDVKIKKISGSGSKELFGSSLFISGDYAVAGAAGDDFAGKDTGAAYIFRYTGTGWEQNTVLRSPRAVPHDRFGCSVALFDDISVSSDELAVVGAYYADGNSLHSGAAYVFGRQGTYWPHKSTLVAADGKKNDYFGYSVSVWGDIALIGAYRNDSRGKDAGAAYVFKRDGAQWKQQAKLTAADGSAGDHFGRSLSVWKDYALIGAMHRDDKGSDSGAAYVFYNNGGTWIQKAKLTAADGAARAFFGFSVSLAENCAIIGAPGAGEGGAAYIFQMSGGSWIPSARLSAGDIQIPSMFGRSVSLSGEYAAVGADGADSGNGAVYLFKKSGNSWGQQEKLIASADSGGRLGAAVSVSSSSSPYFTALSSTGTGADADGSDENIWFFANEALRSPVIDISPYDTETLYLTSCLGAGRESETAPPSSSGRISDDPEDYGRGLIIPAEVSEYWKNNLPIPPPPKAPGQTGQPSLESLPVKKDWSIYDSPVKSQQSCGSCGAFASIALIENLVNQENLIPDADLSEQALLSCVDGITCGGGWHWDVLYHIKYFGAISDNCYPYINKDEDCDYKCNYPEYTVKIADFTPTPGLWAENHSADDLRMALQDGPLVVSMRVPPGNAFAGSGYQGGVYNYEGGEIDWLKNGHAVLLVGYNDAEQSFKVKNSWGEDWGENGYFRIAYDDVTDDVKFGGYACSASGPYMADRATVFTIANRGNADLEISRIYSNKGWLGVSPKTGMTIFPNATRSVIVSVMDWSAIPIAGADGQITISSNDLQNPSVSLNVNASTPFCRPVTETGDINCSGSVDVGDAVSALQILAGIHTNEICADYPYARGGEDVDVNRNAQVGMEEVIYILRKAAGF